MESDNKITLQKANDAISNGDNESFLAYCTDNILWNFVGDQVLEGKDAVRQYMKEVYVTPPRFAVDQLLADGDHVVAMGQIVLKNELGVDVTYDYCDVWRFENGKMAELKAFVSEVK